MRLGRSASATHTGRKRRRNEDAYVCQPPLFAIADGMGGAQAGEIASRLAAAALEGTSETGEDGGERVAAMIQEANRRVHQRSLEDPQASGMGTTMTVALVEDGVVWIGHVGDSRAYLLRDGRLEQVTDDHSLVAELVRSGKVSEEEAQTHPQRAVITRAVGTDPDVDVDTFPIEPQAGDVFLICSDGLTDMVDDKTILQLVERHRDDLDAAARELIAAANKGGGEDNITVIAFEITDAADGATELEQAQQLTAPAAPEPEDEDTLSELDAVPAVDTMIVRPEESERRQEQREELHVDPERPARRDSLVGRALAALVLAAALLGIAALVVWGLLR